MMNFHFSIYEKTGDGQTRKRSYRLVGDDLYIVMKGGVETVVDADDWDKVSGVGWCLNPYGYAVGRVDGKLVSLHSHLFGRVAGRQTDHVDRDKLNNRRTNLRTATKTENQRNRGPHRNSPSGFKGVFRHADRWRARISIEGRSFNLGCFSDSVEAAKAYDRAALEHFGDFAYLNFPEGQRTSPVGT